MTAVVMFSLVRTTPLGSPVPSVTALRLSSSHDYVLTGSSRGVTDGDDPLLVQLIFASDTLDRSGLALDTFLLSPSFKLIQLQEFDTDALCPCGEYSLLLLPERVHRHDHAERRALRRDLEQLGEMVIRCEDDGEGAVVCASESALICFFAHGAHRQCHR